MNDIDVSIEHDISQILPYSYWKQFVIEVLTKLPLVTEPCGQWITNAQTVVQESLATYNLTLIGGTTVTDLIKTKSHDTKNQKFKQIPIKNFFEIKSQTEYTYSSIHGVKGETYDALMLLLTGTRGTTLTPSFLANGSTDTELMRIAYIAMTRPRKLLVIAMPKSTVHLEKRFPKEKWDYIEI